MFKSSHFSPVPSSQLSPFRAASLGYGARRGAYKRTIFRALRPDTGDPANNGAYEAAADWDACTGLAIAVAGTALLTRLSS